MAVDSKWFYKSYWIEDGVVAYIEFIGDFDELGIIEVNEHLRDNYLDKGSAPVHAIIDASGMTGYPRSLKVLQQSTAISVKHPNIGWVILIGFDNPLIKFLSTAVSQVLGVKFKQVETFEQAKEVLKRVDFRLDTSTLSLKANK